ncbi:MAG: methionine gamma-lyase family protein [Eubacterium sp.]|jgi:cystathionine beta-lyase family protein involved in aluminum resistance|nr:methionine gamma-lyase family protein [Eubacterium sp.]
MNFNEIATKSEQICLPYFSEIDRICRFNSAKVLNAFKKCKIAANHLLGTNGYGYDDIGRDKIDEVFAQVLGAEDALVRHGFINGTHAISTALFGILRPGDTLLSVTGSPYNTLRGVISGESGGSLKEFGVDYCQLELLDNGEPDLCGIRSSCKGKKVIYIQRSRGYSFRRSLYVSDIEKIIKAVREVNRSTVIMVDNCYGELCEEREPTEVGADLIIGSLIKNLGGGIAETGGYIAGRKELIELCSQRLTTVGIGREAGCSLNQNRGILLGLYHAPEAVAGALKTSIFASSLFSEMGYVTYPDYNVPRTDIIIAIRLGSAEKMKAFCRGIQSGSPVDSHVIPEAWAMPGYDCEVIMAAGTFTMGASIELSADGPLREPYAVWLQGGLSYEMGRLGVLTAAKQVISDI